MTKAAKKPWKSVPIISVFERRNALGVKECFDDGINPFTVRIQSSAGELTYTYRDIATLYEMSGYKFTHIQSSFVMEEGKKGHERKRITE